MGLEGRGVDTLSVVPLFTHYKCSASAARAGCAALGFIPSATRLRVKLVGVVNARRGWDRYESTGMGWVNVGYQSRETRTKRVCVSCRAFICARVLEGKLMPPALLSSAFLLCFSLHGCHPAPDAHSESQTFTLSYPFLQGMIGDDLQGAYTHNPPETTRSY